MNMHNRLKTTVLFLSFIMSTPSSGMEMVPFIQSDLYKKINRSQPLLQAPPVRLLLEAAPMHVTFPEETQLKIFAATTSKIKNYWCMASKHWQQIGSKSKPHVYNLIQFYSPICAHFDDITFMLFNAVFDGNVEITEQILRDNPDGNFFYEFPTSYIWNCDPALEYRYFDVQDIIRNQGIAFNIAIKYHAAIHLSEKYEKNSKICELLNESINQKQRELKKYTRPTHPCPTHDLMLITYSGEASPITNVLRAPNTIGTYAVERINFALCIAIHKNNKGMIPILLDFIKENKEESQAYYKCIRFFDLAAVWKRKEIFEMLIASDVDRLNQTYFTFEITHIDASFKNLAGQTCSKVTYLDLMEYHAKMYPHMHLDEYIKLIKKHGGKRAAEIVECD